MDNINKDFIHSLIDNVDQLFDQNDNLQVNNNIYNKTKYDKVKLY